jgi:hypothetical protein
MAQTLGAKPVLGTGQAGFASTLLNDLQTEPVDG